MSSKEKELDLKNTETRLDQLCTVVGHNLDNCGAEEKRLALDALDINVAVTRDRVQVQGVMPEDLVTIVRT